jgi:anion-transporting  ArsA/GET3 family ATPase
MAEFITQLNELFGGFRERATMVQKTLRAPDVAFVLVTSPAPMSIQEVLYFSERLEEHKMPRGAFVVNRLHVPPAHAAGVTAQQTESALAANKIALDEGAPERIMRAHADAIRLAALDAHHVEMLRVRAHADKVPIVRVPEFATDVHDLRLLARLADLLMRGGM